MDLEGYRAVLKSVAAGRTSMLGRPASHDQMGVVIALFRQFWTPEMETHFAADADGFRHMSLQLLFGHPSLTALDMATVSTLIDELGTRVGTDWTLSERGQALLCLLAQELERRSPTQPRLF